MHHQLRDAKAYISKEDYAICTADSLSANAFANIVDDMETTVIIDEAKLDFEPLKIEKGWKIITLDIVFPMDTTGVTSRISGAFADAGVSVMPIAAFSRDHFLVRDIEKARGALEDIGITVHR